MSDRNQSRTVHIPPKYDLQGRRQLWFIETGRETVNNLVNGMLTALVVFVPLLILITI